VVVCACVGFVWDVWWDVLVGRVLLFMCGVSGVLPGSIEVCNCVSIRWDVDLVNIETGHRVL
jgi:hypothetical protein